MKRDDLRSAVLRKINVLIEQVQGADEVVKGTKFGVQKVNDALNSALAWMDGTLVNLKDGKGYLELVTVDGVNTYAVPVGVKAVTSLVYDVGGTDVRCGLVTLRADRDIHKMEDSGSLFFPSADQSFFADFRSIGIDGVKLFVFGGVEAGKVVHYWCNLEFDMMTNDSDNLNLGLRLDDLLVKKSVSILLFDAPGGGFDGAATREAGECEVLGKRFNGGVS